MAIGYTVKGDVFFKLHCTDKLHIKRCCSCFVEIRAFYNSLQLKLQLLLVIKCHITTQSGCNTQKSSKSQQQYVSKHLYQDNPVSSFKLSRTVCHVNVGPPGIFRNPSKYSILLKKAVIAKKQLPFP